MEVTVMAVRTEVLWEAGKQAWTALRQLEFTKKQRKLTGYWERKVADRICEFCLALQVIQQKGKDAGAPEVTEEVLQIAEAIAALERLRVLLDLLGKPETIRLDAEEVCRLKELIQAQ
jgi:uncharacterized protein YehS (DUF1456 family)